MEFVRSFFFPYYSFDDENTLIYYISGRYEFKNKGLDVTIKALANLNNKLKQHTLLPCIYNDYIEASKGKIPERWYKAYKKNSV